MSSNAKTAAIVGFGERGQKWARHTAKAGMQVNVFDPHVELNSDKANVVQCELLSEAVENADLIVVTLPDRIALQRTVLQLMQSTVSRGQSILVMSEDSDIDTIQGCAKWPESIVGLNGTALRSLELKTSRITEPDILHQAVGLLEAVGAKPKVMLPDIA